MLLFTVKLWKHNDLFYLFQFWLNNLVGFRVLAPISKVAQMHSKFRTVLNKHHLRLIILFSLDSFSVSVHFVTLGSHISQLFFFSIRDNKIHIYFEEKDLFCPLLPNTSICCVWYLFYRQGGSLMQGLNLMQRCTISEP